MLEISGSPGFRLGRVKRSPYAIAGFRGRVPGKGTENGEERVREGRGGRRKGRDGE